MPRGVSIAALLAAAILVTSCAHPSAQPDVDAEAAAIPTRARTTSASSVEATADRLMTQACKNFYPATHDPGGSTAATLKARANLKLTRAIALADQAAALDPRWITTATDMAVYRDKKAEWESSLDAYGFTQQSYELLTAATTGSRAANRVCTRHVPSLAW